MADIRKSSGENEFSVESKNNFVYSDIPVALCGVEDLMIVQKNGALLVCRTGKGQLVKDAVEEIKKRGMNHLFMIGLFCYPQGIEFISIFLFTAGWFLSITSRQISLEPQYVTLLYTHYLKSNLLFCTFSFYSYPPIDPV